MPVSKTYYSDHVYVKYLPFFFFAKAEDQKKEYLKNVSHIQHDMYTRELYSRTYLRWFKKPTCTVVGDNVF